MRIIPTSVSALALALAMAATASAQQPSQAELQEKLEAELKEPFLQNAPWVLDYAEAMQKAKAENKVIFAYFTRTYAP